MCGRFSEEAELSEIKLELKVEQLEMFREFRPLYNIAPSYNAGHEQLFLIKTREGKRALRLGRWWMIPHFWKKPLKQLPAAFNARAEDLQHKAMWRGAFERFRCLVPATGWREFRPEGKRKQPYQFRLEQERVFAFAGLWSRWTSPEGERVESFAIVTTEPSAQAAAIHDRMPLVIPTELHEGWLDPDSDAAEVLSRARERSLSLPLQVYPVSPRGNDSRFEGPEVVERYQVETEPALAPAARAPAKAPAQRELFASAPDAPARRRVRKTR